MIVERHYDDETLIGLLGSRSADALRDPHLEVCTPCSETLASYRAIADVLGADAVWDLRDLRNEPLPETISTLREMAAAMASDEETAAANVARLLEQPESSWHAAVGRSLDLQTPGVVQALVAASEKTIDSVPARAMKLAALATEVARLLPLDAFQGDTVIRSRGTAWRQYAYAAFFVGDYPRAVTAIDAARQHFESCTVSDYDLARLAIVQSLVLSAQEEYDEARSLAREAAGVFVAFGDRQRVAAARSAEAYAFLQQLRYREALPILEMLERDYANDMDGAARAGLVSNLAVCYGELGRISDAFDCYQIAAAMYDELGSAPEAGRVRYNVAALLAANGHAAEAKTRFRALREQFARLGMPHIVVTADLDIAELLLAEKSYAEAETLCASAVEQFQKLGLSATTQGMTALTYLREAAAQRRATPQTARHVRKYIERLPKEPNLLFAPPPLSPS